MKNVWGYVNCHNTHKDHSNTGLQPSVRTEEERRQLWNECRGLDELGLAGEARRLLDTLPLEEPELAEFRTLRLQLDAWGPESGRAATEGMRLIEREGPGMGLVEIVATALLSAGRGRESWALLQKYPYNADNAAQGYNGARHAAAGDDFDLAFSRILSVAGNREQDLSQALIDIDLASLWDYAAHGALTEEAIHALAHPAMKAFLEAWGTGGGMGSIDWQTRRRLPLACSRWLVPDPELRRWWLSPQAPPHIRFRYQRWLERVRLKNAGFLADGIRRAQDWFLARQMEWAMDKAACGNVLGSRWHLGWALSRDPRRFPDFEAALGRFPDLAPVLEDFRAVYEADPELLRAMAGAFFPFTDLPPDLVETAESLIPDASHNGLWLCIKARMEAKLENRFQQGDAFLAIARRWPADPLGWINMMDLCCDMGAWEGARICLQNAPRSACLFHLHAKLIQQIDRRDRLAVPDFPVTPFYGQEDLGGIMRASSVGYVPGEE